MLKSVFCLLKFLTSCKEVSGSRSVGGYKGLWHQTRAEGHVVPFFVSCFLTSHLLSLFQHSILLLTQGIVLWKEELWKSDPFLQERIKRMTQKSVPWLKLVLLNHQINIFYKIICLIKDFIIDLCVSENHPYQQPRTKER